jgi:hypothetical protein
MIQPEQAKTNAAREGSLMSQIDALAFFTRSITVGEGQNKIVLVDIAKDVYPFLKGLSPKVADGIRAAIDLTMFDDYMPRFYIEHNCDHCGVGMTIETDPEMLYFRKCLAL